MRYLLFNTKEASLERSAQEATARGCSGSTKYWWSTRETKAGKWALCIPNDDNAQPPEDIVRSLTPSEVSKLKNSVVWPDSL